MTTLQSTISHSRVQARKKIKRIKYPGLQANEFVHHLDTNPLNNDLDNLVVVPISFHTHLHSVLSPDWGRPRRTLEQLFEKLEKQLAIYNQPFVSL